MLSSHLDVRHARQCRGVAVCIHNIAGRSDIACTSKVAHHRKPCRLGPTHNRACYKILFGRTAHHARTPECWLRSSSTLARPTSQIWRIPDKLIRLRGSRLLSRARDAYLDAQTFHHRRNDSICTVQGRRLRALAMQCSSLSSTFEDFRSPCNTCACQRQTVKSGPFSVARRQATVSLEDVLSGTRDELCWEPAALTRMDTPMGVDTCAQSPAHELLCGSAALELK